MADIVAVFIDNGRERTEVLIKQELEIHNDQ